MASLDSSGKTHPLVAHVKDGVVRPEEDIPKDPDGLAIFRGQRGALKAHHAVAILLFHRRQHSLTCSRAN